MRNNLVSNPPGVASYTRGVHPYRPVKSPELLGGGRGRRGSVIAGTGAEFAATRGRRRSRCSRNRHLGVQLLARHVGLYEESGAVGGDIDPVSTVQSAIPQRRFI